jgi:diguanylate cyclase (GGDEF)-like protein
MRGRVAELRGQGRLVGLELWTPTGQLVFSHLGNRSQPGSLVPPQGLRGADRVDIKARHGAIVSDDVLHHIDLTGDRRTDVVAVALLPPGQITDVHVDLRLRLVVAGAVLSVLLLVFLLLARRRALRREDEWRREYDARHDSLTGLGNRLHLSESAARLGPDGYALLLLDLDGFKEVNDTLGHAAGDELLVQVAQALRGAVRQTDIVTRFGGDEFAILLPGVDSPDLALRLAEDVNEGLNQTGFTVRDIALDLRASTGVAVSSLGGPRVEALLRQADVAMYRAKAFGGRAVLYSEDEDHHDTDRLSLLAELRQAIENDELTLNYQPIITVASHGEYGLEDLSRPAGSLESVEALVRWQHPHRGLLAPAVFIPVAEHTGLIQPLTAWVLDQAIGQVASWQRNGLDLTVAVNLSPRAINDKLLSQVLTLLDRHGVSAGSLRLEITESANTADPGYTIGILRTLSAAGIQISLDNFGAGETSLAYLSALPLTVLKIDKTLIDAVTTSEKKSAVVSAVIELGHGLGLSMVAEGVETNETARKVADLGCDAIQGDLYSKPMRPDEVQSWIIGRELAVTLRL